MRLIRVPPVVFPEVSKPLTQPKTFKASPDHGIWVQANDIIPQGSPVRKSGVRVPQPLACGIGTEKHSGHRYADNPRNQEVHDGLFSGKRRPTYDHHNSDSNQEADKRRDRVGQMKEPQRHGHNDTVGNQGSGSTGFFHRTERVEKSPHGCEAEDEAKGTEAVFPLATPVTINCPLQR